MNVEKHGDTYRIRDRLGGRDSKKITLASGYPTKSSAAAAMKLLEADKLRGELLDPRAGAVTVAEWVEEWLPGYLAGLKPSTRASESSRLRSLILADLGTVRLIDLTPNVVRTWVADLLSEELAPKSIRNAHGLLHKVMDAAVDERLKRENPCKKTKLPQRDQVEMRFLTEPEAERLVAATPEPYRALVVLMLGTGLRPGEALALRVQDVDVLAGRIIVHRTLHELAKAGVVFTPPKTKAARRSVSQPQTVREAVIPAVAGKPDEALLFTAPNGGPLRPRNFRTRVWIPAVQAAGLGYERLPGGRLGRGLRMHDLRHTHASWLISAGHSLTAIQRRLGHTSIVVTSDLYGHLLPEVDDAILETLDTALGGMSKLMVAA